jgi:hypothetical protein
MSLCNFIWFDRYQSMDFFMCEAHNNAILSVNSCAKELPIRTGRLRIPPYFKTDISHFIKRKYGID